MLFPKWCSIGVIGTWHKSRTFFVALLYSIDRSNNFCPHLDEQKLTPESTRWHPLRRPTTPLVHPKISSRAPTQLLLLLRSLQSSFVSSRHHRQLKCNCCIACITDPNCKVAEYFSPAIFNPTVCTLDYGDSLTSCQDGETVTAQLTEYDRNPFAEVFSKGNCNSNKNFFYGEIPVKEKGQEEALFLLWRQCCC